MQRSNQTKQARIMRSGWTMILALGMCALMATPSHAYSSKTPASELGIRNDSTVFGMLFGEFFKDAKELWKSHTYWDVGLGIGWYRGDWIHLQKYSTTGTPSYETSLIPINQMFGLAVNLRRDLSHMSEQVSFGIELPMLFGAGLQDYNPGLTTPEQRDVFFSGMIGVVPSVFLGTHARLREPNPRASRAALMAQDEGVGYSFGIGPQMAFGRRFAPRGPDSRVLADPKDRLSHASVYLTAAFGFVMGSRTEHTFVPPLRFRCSMSMPATKTNNSGTEAKVRGSWTIAMTFWVR